MAWFVFDVFYGFFLLSSVFFMCGLVSLLVYSDGYVWCGCESEVVSSIVYIGFA